MVLKAPESSVSDRYLTIQEGDKILLHYCSRHVAKMSPQVSLFVLLLFMLCCFVALVPVDVQSASLFISPSISPFPGLLGLLEILVLLSTWPPGTLSLSICRRLTSWTSSVTIFPREVALRSMSRSRYFTTPSVAR